MGQMPATDPPMGYTRATEMDARPLSRAIELAAQARGRTSPNPLVGAVLVKEGRTLAEGFHEAAGQPHAERLAIAACDEPPAGATLYVSLEPCAHTGRTPPCTNAILEAGVARVVVASDDPSPGGCGRGLEVLSGAGLEIAVADGDLALRARLLNQPFRKHAKTGKPHVVFKSAMTLDGKVATRAGDSKWISGADSRALAHRWRAETDAVAVGVGTALADDPMLTARTPFAQRQPVRVVFDSRARLPPDSRLARSADEAPLLLVCTPQAPRPAVAALEATGAQVVIAPGADERARVRSALAELGSRGLQSLLVEGGPRLAGAFLDAGEIDEARVFVAPLMAGGRGARMPLEGLGVDAIAAASAALATAVERAGEDVLITARFKEW